MSLSNAAPPLSISHGSPAGAHAHVVQFYEADAVLLQVMDSSLRRGLDAGAVTIAIAMSAHLVELERQWTAQGLDVESLRAAGRYVPLDAAATLERMCVDGWPCAERFVEVIEPVVAAAARRGPRVVAVGEMVSLLWEQGRNGAALALEEMWNALALRHDFGLLCAYRLTGDGAAAAPSLRDVCAAHALAIPAESYTDLQSPAAQSAEICRLQHEALCLEQAVAARRIVEDRLAQYERELADVLALKETRNARELEDVVSMLGHELRNPLAPIRHATEALRLAANGNATQQRMCGVLDRQVRHMGRLLDDLLDLSRIARGHLRFRRDELDAAEAVARAVEASRPALEARRHQLSVVLPGQALPVRGDLKRLVQALGHLLGNAAKFTPDGGRIELHAAAADGWLELRVRDTGVGITAALLPRVFELFVQGARSLERSPGGLGIGLTLVHGIVEQHGGTVQASSAGPGLGADFLVRLPLAA